MAIVRWTPETEFGGSPGFPTLYPLQQLSSFINPLFSARQYPGAGTPITDQPYLSMVPAVDIIDQKSEFVVKAEVPGVSPNDLKISVANNVLTIRGERLEERGLKSENYYWAERPSGCIFQRSVSLPAPVDPTHVDAFCDNGILTITLSKAKNAKAFEIGVENITGGSARQAQVRSGNGHTLIGKMGTRKQGRTH